MKLKIIAICLVSLLCCHFASGQEIKDGFIILQSGIYQYGNIKFDPALNPYEECLFTPSATREYSKYTPDKVLGYGVIDGIIFTTKEINEGSSKRKYFLKNEFDDVVKFYSFKDSRFFIEKDDFKELTKVGSESFQNVLSALLASCKTIQGTIKKTNFELKSLQSLFQKYQLCTNPESVVAAPSKFLQFDVKAGVEYNSTTVTLDRAAIGKNNFSLIDKTLFSVGIDAIFSFKEVKNLLFVAGAYYYKQNFYTNNRSFVSDYFSTDKINFDYNEILIPVAVQFPFIKKERRVLPYLNAGISIPITLKSSLVWENEKEYSNSVFFEQYAVPQKLKQSLQLTISAGATFSMFGDFRNVLEVSYLKGSGKLEDGTGRIATAGKRYVVLLGFRF